MAPQPQSDGELVRAHLAGDPDAYGALYERYSPGVHDFLSRLVRNRADGADLTQDTFLKAFEQLDTLQDPDKFKSWLFTIAHRTGLNRIRASSRARVDATPVYDDERATMAIADPDPTVDPEQVAASQEAADIVWEAAAGLDERTYTVMDLHVRQGLDSAEIAQVLGVSTGNAYTMVSRMKQRFSAALGTYLLVKTADEGCPVLAGIVGDEVDELTPELRRLADRHIQDCEECSRNRAVYLDPVKVFAGLMMVPVPLAMGPAVWGSVAAGAGVAAAGATSSGGTASTGAAGGGAGGAAGAGGLAGMTAAIGPVGLFAVAAVVAAAVGVGGFLAISSGDDPEPPDDPPAAAGPVVAPPGSEAPAPGVTSTTALPTATTSPPTTTTAAPPTTTSPPTVSKTASQPDTSRVKSCAR